MTSFIILTLAGLIAGSLNAVAGGGTFISFPALIWLGIAPVSANATATLTALPGYFTSAWSFRKEIASESKSHLYHTIILAIVGGCIGAVLLLSTSDRLFSGIVPYLMLFATFLFAFGRILLRSFSGKGLLGIAASSAILLIVSIYGGYFNGGLGIMLLASFSIIGHTNIHYMNGMKNLISGILSLASTMIFIASGLIDWSSALILGIATAIGGFVGGYYSTKIRNIALLRGFIMCVGLFLSAAFFYKYYY